MDHHRMTYGYNSGTKLIPGAEWQFPNSVDSIEIQNYIGKTS